MPKYVIERELPGAGALSNEQLQAISQKSCSVLDRLDTPKEEILHVAQSLFHDIAPANAIGLTTVWVNRRHDRPGFGATPPQEATPALEVPDLRTLAEMADAAFASEGR